jgi:hypothetical protein
MIDKLERLAQIKNRHYDTWEDFKDHVSTITQPPIGVHGEDEVERYASIATETTFGFSFTVSDIEEAHVHARNKNRPPRVAKVKAERSARTAERRDLRSR